MEINLDIEFLLNSWNVKKWQVIFNFFFSLSIILVQFYALVDFEIKMQRTPSISAHISLITLLIFATIQLIFGLEQLLLAAFSFPCFYLCVLLGVFHFNLFFYLVLKTVSNVLRNQVMIEMNQSQTFNIKLYLLKIYLKAHLTILIFFYFSLVYAENHKIYLLWTCALLPQIIENAMTKNRFLLQSLNMNLFYLGSILIVYYNHFFKYQVIHLSKNGEF